MLSHPALQTEPASLRPNRTCSLRHRCDAGKPVPSRPEADASPTFGTPPGPYSGSSTRGCPRAAMWMRIWCGRPVSMVTCRPQRATGCRRATFKRCPPIHQMMYFGAASTTELSKRHPEFPCRLAEASDGVQLGCKDIVWPCRGRRAQTAVP